MIGEILYNELFISYKILLGLLLNELELKES